MNIIKHWAVYADTVLIPLHFKQIHKQNLEGMHLLE